MNDGFREEFSRILERIIKMGTENIGLLDMRDLLIQQLIETHKQILAVFNNAPYLPTDIERVLDRLTEVESERQNAKGK